MKKVFAIILAVLLVMGLAGCGGQSPEQAVKSAFDAIKKNDSKTASNYVNYQELLKAGKSGEEASDSELGAESDKMAESILRHFDYKIITSSEKGDSATVKVEITNIDMKAIMVDFISEVFTLGFSGLNEETMDAQLNNKFNELINRADNKTVTKTVDLKLTKSGSSWKIAMGKEAADAIFGGMLSIAEDLNSSFGGDDDSDKLSEIESWLTDDIWNKGFCDISWYASSGTGSTGETLDIDFTLSQLDAAMEKKAEYDAYINSLDNEFSHLKEVWKKLSPEIDTLYAQIKKTKPVANDTSTGIDTGKFTQYEEAFSDALYDKD